MSSCTRPRPPWYFNKGHLPSSEDLRVKYSVVMNCPLMYVKGLMVQSIPLYLSQYLMVRLAKYLVCVCVYMNGIPPHKNFPHKFP